MTTAIELWDKLRCQPQSWLPTGEVFAFVVTPNERETILSALRGVPTPQYVPPASTDMPGEQLRAEIKGATEALTFVETWRRDTAILVKQLEEQLKKMPPSPWPGCGYCMENGTPVKPGEICPECGDRSPERA